MASCGDTGFLSYRLLEASNEASNVVDWLWSKSTIYGVCCGRVIIIVIIIVISIVSVVMNEGDVIVVIVIIHCVVSFF